MEAVYHKCRAREHNMHVCLIPQHTSFASTLAGAGCAVGVHTVCEAHVAEVQHRRQQRQQRRLIVPREAQRVECLARRA